LNLQDGSVMADPGIEWVRPKPVRASPGGEQVDKPETDEYKYLNYNINGGTW